MICVIGWNIFAECMELVGKLPEACESLSKTMLAVVFQTMAPGYLQIAPHYPRQRAALAVFRLNSGL